MEHIGQEETEFLKKHINAKERNGLDIGCGGRKTIPQCVGIDVARDESTDKSCGADTAAEWVCSGDALPFQDESVDYILSRHVLEHMDWQIALAEWARVLKEGGLLCIVVPDPTCSNHPGHGIPITDVKYYCEQFLEMSFLEETSIHFNDGTNYSWGLIYKK